MSRGKATQDGAGAPAERTATQGRTATQERTAAKYPPSLLAALLAAGTCLIGALLAYQYSQLEAVAPDQVRNLLYAFLLAALFTLAALLFSKAQARQEAA